jgi:two-component system, NtrC family, nitrogen regulation sensor histidine kinase GlnL
MAEPGRRVIGLVEKPHADKPHVDDIAPAADEIFGASPTALLLVDPSQHVVRANAATETLINTSNHHIIGRPINEVLNLPQSYDASGEGAYAAYDIALSTPRGAAFRADILITPFSDRPGWRLISLQAGAAAHRMGHRLDRSSGVRAAVGIAAMLAHEIKNPLSGIRGAAQLLDSSVDENGKRMTKLIRDEVDRVAALIDRMEGFTDARPLERTSENIHAIIDHARAVATSGFGDRITICDSYDPSLPPVLVHRDSLVQIILNLLKNAAETVENKEKRIVTITTAYRHGVSVTVDGGTRKLSLPIELCVFDDGPGAPPELIDHLFDPFISSKAKGHGLGLALVDKLVRDMGGFIQYAREGQPERTVFRLLLPRSEGVIA